MNFGITSEIQKQLEELYASIKLLKSTVDNTFPDETYDDVLVFASKKIMELSIENKILKEKYNESDKIHKE